MIGLSWNDFLDLTIRSLETLSDAYTQTRENTLNDDILIGIRNAIKNIEAFSGSRKLTSYKPIKLDYIESKNNIVEERNRRVIESLVAMGLI